MRNFLKTKLQYGIQPYIQSAIENQTHFCFSYYHLPKPKSDLLNKPEMDFIYAAPTGKTQMRPIDLAQPHALTVERLQKISSGQQISVASNVERVIGGASLVPGQISYDMNTLKVKDSNQHSLDNRFKLINQTKELNQLSKTIDNEDEKMDIDMPNDQDNINFGNLSEAQIMDAVSKQDLLVFNRFDLDERNIIFKSGEADKAFFALLASEMLEIADKYKRDVEEVHKIFFEVSCQKDKLIKILEGQSRALNYKWTPLEDIALVNNPENSEQHRYLVANKGDQEVLKRKQFLQI